MIRSFVLFALTAFVISCSSTESETHSSKDQNSQPAQEQQKQSTTQANKAPGFSLASTDGKTVDFSQFQGKLVLVDFWATWCPPCRRSIPHLVDLHKKYSSRGFEVVGISLDQTGTESVANFVRDNAIPYTILMGTQDVAQSWDIGRGIPVAFLVNRDGAVVEKIVGYRDSQFWEQKISQYL